MQGTGSNGSLNNALKKMMVMHKKFVTAVLGILFAFSGLSGRQADEPILPGAYLTDAYFPLLQGKRIAVAGNHTSLIGDVHLVDTLLASGFDLIRVFSPEHGFRGQAADGELISSTYDAEKGLEVVSLYGRNRRPQQEHLEDLDIIVFDMQDVGARFYTYISTMTFIMDEAARANIPVIVLDRPNPNIHYVDGPVMELEHASFVGLHPVPVVYGMTIGEYAMMVNGEGWLRGGVEADLRVVEVANYHRRSQYTLPVAPSPNLPNMTSVYLYPSLCFFEGTVLSIGRGTDKAFQLIGHPDLPPETYTYSFTPERRQASVNPPQLGKTCHGKDLSGMSLHLLQEKTALDLSYLINAYRDFPDKQGFFNDYFERLAGNSKLRYQIMVGYTEEDIRASWQDELEEFLQVREQYLLYPEPGH